MTAGDAWRDLATDYEMGRQREDSLDRLLEWPAQQQLVGDPKGLRILDVGCGSGAKAAHWAHHGAAAVTGIDISGHFISNPPDTVRFITADLSYLDDIEELRGHSYDRIVFFQSISYASDQVHTLRCARNLLARNGRIIVQRSHPIRFAVERAEANGTSLGAEYYSTEPYYYRSGWNEQVTLTHSTETFATMLNTFTAAGLFVEHAVEPQLNAENRNLYPHKQQWLERYLGVLIFVLRPITD